MGKNRRMREEQKKTIKLPAIILVLILILVIVLIVVFIKKPKNKQEPVQTTEMAGIALDDTTYENMQVGNISMEYLEDNDQTMISMTIFNTTSNKIVDENLNAILLDENGGEVSRIETFIKELNPSEEYDISVVLSGNLTQTKNIKLEKVENEN